MLAYQRFLQETGGHTGGWAEEDHLLFLHLRKKYKGNITFLNLLKERLPGKLWYRAFSCMSYVIKLCRCKVRFEILTVVLMKL